MRNRQTEGEKKSYKECERDSESKRGKGLQRWQRERDLQRGGGEVGRETERDVSFVLYNKANMFEI